MKSVQKLQDRPVGEAQLLYGLCVATGKCISSAWGCVFWAACLFECLSGSVETFDV